MEVENNPFAEDNALADVVLVVGDQRFHVNKYVLMISSPVFEKMFTDNFLEKSSKEVELKDDNPADFLEFLTCLYPNIRKPISVNNALSVVSIADKYQVASLRNECETTLTENCRTIGAGQPATIVTYIEAAEKFDLKELLPVCVSTAVQVDSRHINSSKISIETQHEIFKRRVASFESLMTDLDSNYDYGRRVNPEYKEVFYKDFYNIFRAYKTGEKTYWK